MNVTGDNCVCDGHDFHAFSELPQRLTDDNFRPRFQGVKVRQHVDMYAPHEKEPSARWEGNGSIVGKTQILNF